MAALTDRQIAALSRLLTLVAVHRVPPHELLDVADRLDVGTAYRAASRAPPNKLARCPTFASSTIRSTQPERKRP